MWFVIGLFETLICAIAEDKVCDSCTVSSWALLIYFTLSVMIQISCAVWLRKMENLTVTFCYLWLTENFGSRNSPPPPPIRKMFATDTWRSLGCRTTPLKHWSKRKPTVETRWAKQRTKILRPQPTKINSFMSGPSLSLTPDPPTCN